MLASTPEQLEQLREAITTAQAAVAAEPALEPQGPAEDAAAFAARETTYNNRMAGLNAAVTTAEAALTAATARRVLTSYLTVAGDDVSPGDALMVVFWIIMDIVFCLGD